MKDGEYEYVLSKELVLKTRTGSVLSWDHVGLIYFMV